MKKQLIILSLALLATFGFYSCKKKYTTIPAPTPFSSLRDSFEFMSNNNIQDFIVDASVGRSFTTKSGIEFTVPADAFRNEIGEVISAGLIEIEIVEMLTTNDMIFNQRSTTSDGDVLVTGGQFKISYSLNGNPVNIGFGVDIEVVIPTDIGDDKMQVFYGEEDPNGFVNWSQALKRSYDPFDSAVFTDNPIPVIVTDTVTQGGTLKFYNFQIDNESTNWINCDYFYDVPGNKTPLTLTLDEDYNNLNTLFFVHFKEIQSVMTGYFDGNNFVTAGQIPTGTSVTLIFASEIDGDYYYKAIDIVVSNGYSGTIEMDPSSYNDIISNINEL